MANLYSSGFSDAISRNMRKVSRVFSHGPLLPPPFRGERDSDIGMANVGLGAVSYADAAPPGAPATSDTPRRFFYKLNLNLIGHVDAKAPQIVLWVVSDFP